MIKIPEGIGKTLVGAVLACLAVYFVAAVFMSMMTIASASCATRFVYERVIPGHWFCPDVAP